MDIWDRQLTTRGLKLGSKKGIILAARNEPKFGALPIVYLHAGLEIGSAIPYAIHRPSNGDSHALPYVLIWIRYFTQWFYPV